MVVARFLSAPPLLSIIWSFPLDKTFFQSPYFFDDGSLRVYGRTAEGLFLKEQLASFRRASVSFFFVSVILLLFPEPAFPRTPDIGNDHPDLFGSSFQLALCFSRRFFFFFAA